MYALRSAHALQLTRQAVQLPRSQVRHFHPTRPASFSIIGVALDSSTAFIHGVHTVSCLPWVASIPLTAVLVRTFVGLPILLYTRLHRHREKKLSPILSAWTRRYFEKHTEQHNNSRPTPSSRISRRKKVLADAEKRRKTLHKRWEVSNKHKYIGFLQIPVFIALMESLRGMSGNNSGIIAWVSSFIEPSQDPASAANSLHLTIEPTLANEGALWFPDLLAGDSTGVLPCLLTASIVGNAVIGWKVHPWKEISLLPTQEMYKKLFSHGLRSFVIALACYVGSVSWYQGMPTALMLYWITSTNVATLQTWVLDNKVFSPVKSSLFVPKSIAFEKPGDKDPFHLKNLR